MLIIAHRGNLEGPSPQENKPEYIQKALDYGFIVEVDVWGIDCNSNNMIWLGHDGPHYPKQFEWLLKPGLFIHCKDIAALWHCKELGVKHYFSHDKDKAVMTSSGYFWTYPDNNIELTKFSIPVIFSKKDSLWGVQSLSQVAGICTDYPVHYDALFNQGAI
jgi:hypothetical protein